MNNPWTWTDEDEGQLRDMDYRLHYLVPVPGLEEDAAWLINKLRAARREIGRLENDLGVEQKLRDECQGGWEAGYAVGWDDGRESLLKEQTNTSNSSSPGIVIDEAEVK
jgi:hypothetical protein